MTALWLMKLSDEKWDDIISEVREYGIKLAREMGPVQKQRALSDDEWENQNARDENDWCLPTTVNRK
jgi:hypothetical protein